MGRVVKLVVALLSTVLVVASGAQEYFAVATRKLSVAAEAAQKKVEVLAALDAVIVHAARRAGCDRLMTEARQSGQRIEGVEIVNPFA
jgi:predicted nucleic acid-binding protein